VPIVGDMPAGCRFAPRCAARSEACVAMPPPLKVLSTTHAVACVGASGMEVMK
jgi:peptide/nickel transport system ATP-binding protein